MKRRELEGLSPSFRWKEYFSQAGQPGLQSLNVAAPEFFKTMDATLKKESLDNWKAYLRWHLVDANAPYLSTAFVDADFDFFGKTLTGAQQLEPRWKRCVNYVDNDLGEALGQAYVERAFPPEAKQRAQKMVKQIEAAMEQDIDSLSWMSPATKQQALEKLHALANKIGYPDKWRDYSALTIARDDYMGNVLRARGFEFNRQIAKIGKPVDRGEWDMTPPTVNAYYNPQMNDINFPGRHPAAALFRSPRRRCSELRRHRRHHWTRTDPRLRRRRPPVRRPGQPARLVDRGRRQAVRPARQLHLRPVFTICRGRRHQGQWAADPGRECRRSGRHDAGLHGLERLKPRARNWNRLTASRPSSASSSATDRAGVPTRATKPNACTPPSIPTRPTNTGSTESSPTHPSFSRPSSARPVPPWCGRRDAESGKTSRQSSVFGRQQSNRRIP